MTTLFAGAALAISSTVAVGASDTAALAKAASAIVTHTAPASAAAAVETLVLTGTDLKAGDVALAQVVNYAGAGEPVVLSTTVAANGSDVELTIKYKNVHASAALDADVEIAVFTMASTA